MSKRRPLTREEHADLGASLQRMRDELQTRFVQYAERHRVKEPATTRWCRLLRKLDELRSMLDAKAAAELGDAYDVRLFYPAGHKEQPVYW